MVRAGIAHLVETGHHLGLERHYSFLADAYVAAGDVDAALGALADGEDASFDQQLDRPGTMLRRAELVAARGDAPHIVESAFVAALACTRRLGTKWFELRTATRYARWLHTHDRSAEARDLLVPLYARFTEGFDTRDLMDARQLCGELDGYAAAADHQAYAVESGGRTTP